MNALISEHIIEYAQRASLPALARDLDRLYGARYATLAHFEIYGTADGGYIYQASRDGQAEAVLFFTRAGEVVTVLNEGVAVGNLAADRFARYIFLTWPAVTLVRFRYIGGGAVARHDFLHHRTVCDSDMVLTLPATTAAYHASVGASTRKNINNALNKLRRDYPSLRIEVLEKEAVPALLLRQIIALQRERMHELDKMSMIDHAEERRIAAYVARCGFVVVIRNNATLIAGTINYRHGGNFTARALGHNAAFERYHVGFTAVYLSICECIKAAPGGLFYFGWGHGDYKYRLGGQARPLYHLSLYRNVWARLRHALPALAGDWQQARYRGGRWLIGAAAGDGRTALMVRRLIDWKRRLGRLGGRMARFRRA